MKIRCVNNTGVSLRPYEYESITNSPYTYFFVKQETGLGDKDDFIESS